MFTQKRKEMQKVYTVLGMIVAFIAISIAVIFDLIDGENPF